MLRFAQHDRMLKLFFPRSFAAARVPMAFGQQRGEIPR
jgi:hypothetical protein